jgi:hypothetical protein
MDHWKDGNLFITGIDDNSALAQGTLAILYVQSRGPAHRRKALQRMLKPALDVIAHVTCILGEMQAAAATKDDAKAYELVKRLYRLTEGEKGDRGQPAGPATDPSPN